MKLTNKILVAIAMLLLFTNLVNAQSKTAAAPVDVAVLKAREALLKETTNLNKLKIKLANLNTMLPKLEEDLNKANARSTKSAIESKSLSAKMSAKVGDDKSAKRASSAAKVAYNDARKAQQLTNQLKSAKEKIRDLKSAIDKSRAKIAKMDEQLKFTGSSKN